MSRLLPYIIICLVIFAFTKVMGFLSIQDNPEINNLGNSVVNADSYGLANASNEQIDNSKNTPKQQENTNKEEKNLVNDGVNADNESKKSIKKDEQIEPSDSTLNSPSSNSNNVNPYSLSNKPGIDFSPAEIEILQSLRKRRQELENRAEEISVKESTLFAISEEVEVKISNLAKLQKQLTVLLKEYKEKENAKTAKLVKIYESMKPREAAKILEELQMNVLLDVAENMKEAKLASIVAEMDPLKAKELTMNLASRRVILE